MMATKKQTVRYNECVEITMPEQKFYVQASVKKGRVTLTITTPDGITVSDPLPLTVAGNFEPAQLSLDPLATIADIQ